MNPREEDRACSKSWRRWRRITRLRETSEREDWNGFQWVSISAILDGNKGTSGKSFRQTVARGGPNKVRSKDITGYVD